MKKTYITTILLLLGLGINVLSAQTTSASNNLVAQPIPDRTVLFNIADAGISKSVLWGLDTAWANEANIRRGAAFMGQVDVVRVSFQPTLPLVNGDIQTDQINAINLRIELVNWTGSSTKLAINCDHPSVDASYIGNAVNWATLMDQTAKRFQAVGRKVISVSPFNEPDFGWGQFSGSNGQSDFYNIAVELRKNTRFDSIRICGGNTLNCDQALPWYNYLKAKLDEGNTHQLAGTFDNFTNFYTTVRANGDYATADEMHNVMEAMVGYEYGLQTGIWWGPAELARGEFCKASHGQRLGYAEHRVNWTAASVYRAPSGKIQAFGGTSERQGVATTYRFISKDRDVYYDGYGPQREYTMVLPGGTGYQTGQTNAERVVTITSGADIQPVINGRYILVNRKSSKVIEPSDLLGNSGAIIRQNTNKGSTYQQWNVTPVDSRVGGDFSYFTFTNANSAKSLDVLNYSLENNGTVQLYDDGKSANQQWYLEYLEDGWFYIRSRFSAKCLTVINGVTVAGAGIVQSDNVSGAHQLWRFLPVTAPVEFVAPTAPGNLIATPNAESVRLDWSASPETDVAGYTVFRSETAGGPYNTIARNVTSTSFVDNTATAGGTYFYTVKAIDNSLNRSVYSSEVSATPTGSKDLVAYLQFNGNSKDTTNNLNHGASLGTISYVTGKIGTGAIWLNGSNTFLQLPPNVANHKELTIAAWVFWKGGSAWQRLFDFGNDQTQYMFLTPSMGQMRFAIKNGGTEQVVNTTMMPTNKWTHVAVTIGTGATRIYVNGVLAVESTAITISPLDIKPILNYIGRSQFSTDPLFNGNIDEFRVYNYALSATEVAQISTLPNAVETPEANNDLSLWPIPANDVLHISSFLTDGDNSLSKLAVFNMDGRAIISKSIIGSNGMELNISGLSAGIYLLKLTNKNQSTVKRFLVKH